MCALSFSINIYAMVVGGENVYQVKYTTAWAMQPLFHGSLFRKYN